MSKVTIEEAKKRLKKEEGDSEGYHFEFDLILEERLMELDPKFMKALHKLYRSSNEARWYA